MMRKIYLGIMALVAFMGLAFAIQPVQNWTVLSTGMYSGTPAPGYVTQGGNVTNLNIASNISTTRWAGYWGNVAGNIVLSPATDIFYQWAWTSANGGKVCAIAAPAGFDWTQVQAAAGSDVDTVWGFGASTDNAVATLATPSSITIGSIAVNPTDCTNTGGSGYTTCVVGDKATGTLTAGEKGDLAFCTAIDSTGTPFNGGAADYELLAPTNQTISQTETHYFWLELD
jgi:hypothetical protein